MAWKPDYATTAELKAFARITHTDSDAQVAIAVTAASRAIDEHCNRQFGIVATAEERLYTAQARTDRGRWVVDIDDLMTTTALVVEVAGDALTGYTLEPRNAAAEGKPWTRLVVDEDATVLPAGDEYEIAITASWGWTAVPTAVKQATLLQGSRFLSRRDSPYGVAGSPDIGSELRLLARVDPDVAVALRGFTRPRAVG
jgi:hypothetical protein